MRVDDDSVNTEDLQHGVEDACGQHTLGADFTMSDFDGVGEAADVDVVGAVDEDNMNARHAGEEWNDAPSHDFVFAKKAFVANVAAGQAKTYEDHGENGAPPAVEQGRVVADAGAALRGGSIVKVARKDHGW